MRAREFVIEDTAEGLTEIENMPAKQFVGGKSMLNTRKRPAKQNLQPLLSGTDLLYAVDQDRHGPRVVIVESGVSTGTKPRVVAALYLAPVDYLPNTVQVASITVNEDYRGRGLAKALYGIVFTKMRKNLLSGDEQTPGGKRNWMSLVNMPGVQVKGLVRIDNDIFDLNKNRVPSNYQKYIDQTIDQIMELGGQFFHKDEDFSYWLFDVVPGKGQLQPYVQNSLSKLYGYDARNLLLATWNQGINESQQDLAEDAESEVAESTSPSITVKDAKRALLAMGFEPTGRGKGSHDVWKDSSGLLFTIPVHGKDLEYGVAKTLLKLIRSRQTALEEMGNRQINDDELPDLPMPKDPEGDWTAQTDVDTGHNLARTQYSNRRGFNVGISADNPMGPVTSNSQRGVNIGYGPASLNIGDKGAISGSYNIPLDDKSSVSLTASGQKNSGLAGVGARYQRDNWFAGVDQPNFPGAKPQFNVGYSAKFEEAELEEMAGKIHGGVRKALMDKGYKYLGGGIDKQAYLEPGGQVLIVFGYRPGNTEDFSPDQRMFIDWINYCNANKNNPNLPRFSGFESFEFQGKNYIQARMETLQELPKTVGTLVGQIDQVTKQIGQGNFKSAYKKIKSYAEDYYAPEYNPQYFEDIKEVVDLLGGPERADGLLKTVYEVSRFARKHNFTVDLHSGNYMQRPDGTIVVNDPFVIWERNL
jgi:predicted RNA binding protein YcfA (HicA-like mRNA interferase family)/predicted GNAT family acetyltransferase